MTQAQHIVVVDDEQPAREMVGDYLRMHGFGVSLCDGGVSLRKTIAERMPDLIILDLNMPEEDGLSIIRDLKQRTSVPIIMLTATASAIDRVVGLELGADDYLTKPVSLRELVARIRAILRRAERGGAGADPAGPARRYRFSGWELAVRTRRLTSPDGRQVPLTRGEFGLLLAFLTAPQQILSREQLLTATRLHDADVFDRSIDVQILRLRRKLEADPSRPAMIRTERGAGYVMAVAVEVQ
jgi:two-component system, OmpR family, response regulator